MIALRVVDYLRGPEPVMSKFGPRQEHSRSFQSTQAQANCGEHRLYFSGSASKALRVASSSASTPNWGGPACGRGSWVEWTFSLSVTASEISGRPIGFAVGPESQFRFLLSERGVVHGAPSVRLVRSTAHWCPATGGCHPGARTGQHPVARSVWAKP